MITTNHTTLRMSGVLNIEHLTALKLHVGVNAHGWAIVEGEAGENALEQLSGALAGREQHILTLDESGMEKCLFAGVIREAELVRVGGYNRFHVELLSGTCLMDREVRSRSFQDVGRTYSQVAQQVCSEYSGGAAICTVGEDKTLGQPVIQYRETDWEFLMRMVSHCSGVLVPETHRSLPRLWFGFPDRSYTCEFPEDAYTSGISQRYYELGGSAAGYSKADFFYYDVESPQLCDLGWYTVFKGQPFIIAEKSARLERGELIFTYRLGRPGLGWGKMLYNEKISGMTLLGEVLETSRETLKLKLDIDAGWDPGGPYPYTWRPETGNFMYCMPKVGTRVSLYCPNFDERAAVTVNCVRTNGDSCSRMSNPAKRSFVTEHGKEMNLYPEEMSLLGGSEGLVRLFDDNYLSISSKRPLTIIADQEVSFLAPTITVIVPEGEIEWAKVCYEISDVDAGEIKLAKVCYNISDVKSSVSISNRYDFLSEYYSLLEGWNCQPFPAYQDAPEIAEESDRNILSQVIGGAIIGLAVVGAVAIVGVVAAAIAGVAATTAIVGGAYAFALGAIGTAAGVAVDIATGNPRSLGRTVVDSLCWAFSGVALFTGGIGAFAITGLLSAGRNLSELAIGKGGQGNSSFTPHLLGPDSTGEGNIEIGNVSTEYSNSLGYSLESTYSGDPRPEDEYILGFNTSAKMEENFIHAKFKEANGEVQVEGQGNLVNSYVSGEIGATLFKNGLFTPNITANASVGGNIASGEIEGKRGDDEYNVHLGANGELMDAEASAGLEVGKIDKIDSQGRTTTCYGVEATVGAEAYVAQGEISGGFTVMGIDFDVSIGGKIGGFGAEAGTSITTGAVEGEISLGFLAGLGVGFEIDWTDFTPPDFSTWFN